MLAESDNLRVLMRMMFWSVAWLDLYACSCTYFRWPNCPLKAEALLARGQPTFFVVESTTTGVPFSTTHDRPFQTRLYNSLKRLFIIMSFLKDIMIDTPTRRAHPIGKPGLEEMRRFLTAVQAGLPTDMSFTREALMRAQANHSLQYFVLMHQLIHTLVVFLHCPLLFWIDVGVGAAWSSARFVVNMFETVNALDTRFLVGTPCFLFPLSVARAAFSLEEQAYASVPWSSSSGSSAYAMQSDCQEYVTRVEALTNSILV